MSRKNTPNRLKVLTAFRRDPCATLRELAERTGLSVSGVYYQVVTLASDGVITYNRPVGNYNHKSHPGPTSTQQDWNRIKKTVRTRRNDLEARIDAVVAGALVDQRSAFSDDATMRVLSSGVKVIVRRKSSWVIP